MSLTVSEAFLQAQVKRLAYVVWLMLGIMAFAVCNQLHEFSWNYAGNAFFEYVGSGFLLLSVFRLWAQKQVRGYHWGSTAFFMTWGYWNIFYYPSVGDWWSFTAGLFIVSVNTFWLGQMFYYRHN